MSKTPDPTERLLSASYTFRRLHEEHQTHDTRLHELSARPVPTSEEEAEERHLKKRKLYLKDRMSQILHDYERTGALPDEIPGDKVIPFPTGGRASGGERSA